MIRMTLTDKKIYNLNLGEKNMAKVKKTKKTKIPVEEVKPVKKSKGKKAKVEKTEKKKKSFGGVTVNFDAVKDMTLGEVYGDEDLTMGQIPKKIWEVIHEHNLSTAPPKTPLKLLKKYWKDTKCEDVDEDLFKKHVKACGGQKRAMKEITSIFADCEDEEFESEMTAFYKKFVKAVKAKKE